MKLTKDLLIEELEGHEFYYLDRGVCGCVKGKVIDGGRVIADLNVLPKVYAYGCFLAQVLMYWPDVEDEGAMRVAEKQARGYW